MQEKEKLDGLLRLSDQLYRQYHDRTSLEWRIHVAFWALLAGAAYAAMTQKPHFGCWSLIILLVVPLHFVWTVKIHIGNVKEQDASIEYREAVEEMLGFKAPDCRPSMRHERSQMPPSLIKRFENYFWWPAVEVGTSVMLCALVIIEAW